MRSKALSFLSQVLRWDVTQAVESLGLDQAVSAGVPTLLGVAACVASVAFTIILNR